jgi:uncharacterized spore protein YtfJ
MLSPVFEWRNNCGKLLAVGMGILTGISIFKHSKSEMGRGGGNCPGIS